MRYLIVYTIKITCEKYEIQFLFAASAVNKFS